MSSDIETPVDHGRPTMVREFLELEDEDIITVEIAGEPDLSLTVMVFDIRETDSKPAYLGVFSDKDRHRHLWADQGSIDDPFLGFAIESDADGRETIGLACGILPGSEPVFIGQVASFEREESVADAGFSKFVRGDAWNLPPDTSVADLFEIE
jgi:hypothetical protein